MKAIGYYRRMKIHIREANLTDIPEITEIYNWHCTNGTATFSDVVSIENRKEWLLQFNQQNRTKIFVAVAENQVVGYACNMVYRGGEVFRNTTETSIYTRNGQAGRGIGSLLYAAVIGSAKNMNYHRIVVGIALPNEGSVKLHRKFGFEDIGVFDEYAFYKGRYFSSLWMQKRL